MAKGEDAHIDMTELRKFMKQLREFEPDVAKETRNRFRALAKVVAQDARGRAQSWAKTGKSAKSIIPIADSTGWAGISSSHPGLRTNEFGNRHPLFGNKVKWYQQVKRPTMYPAVEANVDKFEREALLVVEAAARKAGFR